MRIGIVLALLIVLPFTNACFTPTQVMGTRANIHLDWRDSDLSFPVLTWDITIQNSEKVARSMRTTETPITLYLRDLQEWNLYHVEVRALRSFTINETVYEYVEQARCSGNVTTIPPALRIDTVDSTYTRVSVTGTAQIFDPQRYKVRFEWGSIHSYAFSHATRYEDVQGVGVVTKTFPTGNPSKMVRMRFVLKSRPPFPETYASPAIVVWL